MFYAQLNEANICIGISDLWQEVENPLLVPLEDWDITLLGKKYQAGSWEDLPSAENMSTFLSTEEIIMQTLADIEIYSLKAEQERQLLAQQLTDIELSLLQRGESNV
ncbi:MAG: hypothetical protein GX299_02420 [Epulopiscium sp.]|nr:hypothetical protein [Candidatus Epulonipiscium sp.]